MTVVRQVTIEEHIDERILYNPTTGELESHPWVTTYQDGKVINRERRGIEVIPPGADLTTKSEHVKLVAKAVWTPQNVAAWTEAFIAAQAAERAKREQALAEAEDRHARLNLLQAEADLKKTALEKRIRELEILEQELAAKESQNVGQ